MNRCKSTVSRIVMESLTLTFGLLLLTGCASKQSSNLRPSMLNNPGGARAFTDTEDFEQEFSLQGASIITITNLHGPVSVFAEDRDNIICRGNKKVSASGFTRAKDPNKSMSDARKATKKGIKKTRFASKLTKDALEISLEAPEARDGVFGEVSRVFVDVSFSVPKGVSVYLDNDEGAILVDGVRGNVKVIQGGTGLGAIIRNVEGNVDVNTYNGPQHVGRILGNANLMCISGEILTQDIAGTGIVQTRRGDVTYLANQPPLSDLALQTRRGDVTVYLPVTSDIIVEASATKGKVECKLPIRASRRTNASFSGQMGSGDAKMVMRSYDGNIEILTRNEFPDLLENKSEMTDEEFEKAREQFRENFEDDGSGRPRWQQEDPKREIIITPKG